MAEATRQRFEEPAASMRSEAPAAAEGKPTEPVALMGRAGVFGMAGRPPWPPPLR